MGYAKVRSKNPGLFAGLAKPLAQLPYSRPLNKRKKAIHGIFFFIGFSATLGVYGQPAE